MRRNDNMSRVRIENLTSATTLSETEATTVVAGAVYIGIGNSGYSPVYGNTYDPWYRNDDCDYTPNYRYGNGRFNPSWYRVKPSRRDFGRDHHDHHNHRGFGRRF